MKPITQSKTPKAQAPQANGKAAAPQSPKKQAQCCAKVSRITAGCHD